MLREVRPNYTAEAVRQRIAGIVRIECVVATTGEVSDARLVRGLDSQSGLDTEALKAARGWLFRPATDASGTPVAVLVELELTFALPRGLLSGTPQPQPAGTPPRKLVHVDPAYPANALAARTAGDVIIEAVVDEAGNVTMPVFWQSVPMLDAAALAAVSQWKYEPTLVNGVGVKVPMVFAVSFKLR